MRPNWKNTLSTVLKHDTVEMEKYSEKRVITIKLM